MVVRQVAGELQCNIGCLANFVVVVHEALHEVELRQHHYTVYHPSSNFSRNITAILSRAHFSFFVNPSRRPELFEVGLALEGGGGEGRKCPRPITIKLF